MPTKHNSAAETLRFPYCSADNGTWNCTGVPVIANQQQSDRECAAPPRARSSDSSQQRSNSISAAVVPVQHTLVLCADKQQPHIAPLVQQAAGERGAVRELERVNRDPSPRPRSATPQACASPLVCTRSCCPRSAPGRHGLHVGHRTSRLWHQLDLHRRCPDRRRVRLPDREYTQPCRTGARF